LLFLPSEPQRLDPLERLDKELEDPDPDDEEDGVGDRRSSDSGASGTVARCKEEVSSVIDFAEGNGG
jgi:hypothetical protein